ncbi:hypothetical protein [Aureimonas glaciei]|uniref:Uncharacterized protein n=1 Tax=Aureimonas glaciei TaxID=1776957 RepID=A0A917DJC2_9HYPH|nr:hypothetical protein [Aureimonas glaciei]GGD41788.1 hypothetical protein GCM10011335_50590 [Aureimonas glaciei]
MIAAPKTAADYADRAIDCQFAMETAFQDLARRAEFAGWTEDDVSAALLELARSHIKGIIADRKTAVDLAEADKQGQPPASSVSTVGGEPRSEVITDA